MTKIKFIHIFLTFLTVSVAIVGVRYFLRKGKSETQLPKIESAGNAGGSALNAFSVKDAFLQNGNFQAYASGQDSLDRNALNSGFINRSATFFATSFINGSTIYTNILGTDKVPSGYYFYPYENKAFYVNSDGVLTFFTGTVIDLPDFDFKNAYLSGGNYIAYASVAEALEKNAEGSGVTNQTVVVRAIDITDGRTLYADNAGTIKLTAGYYYYTTIGKAIAVDAAGVMVIVEPINATFTEFEQNVLPGLVAGTSDIPTKNTTGFEVFPDTNGQPTEDFTSVFYSGDYVGFLNHSGDTPPPALAKGLSTGFDNGALNTINGVPAEHRYKWSLYNDFAMWQLSHAELELRGAIEWPAVKSHSRDSNQNLVPHRVTMIDIEAGVTDFTKINSFLKGFYNAAKADDPNHVVIYYGLAPNRGFTYWHNGYYYDSDNVPLKKKFFPASKPSYNQSKAKVSSGIINPYFSGKPDMKYNILVSYPKVNMPLSTTIYQKSGGNFIFDSDGDRVLKDTVQEVQRGETITWAAAGNISQISTQEGNNFGEYRLMSELFHAINQFGGLYSDIFFRLQMLSNELGLGDDFQDLHAGLGRYGTVGMLRPDAESNPFTNLYRPLDRFTSEYFAALVFTSLNELLQWTGFTGGNIGLTLNGAYAGDTFIPDLYKTVMEGQPFNTQYFGEGGQKTMGHLGPYRQFAAKMYQMQSENREYGLWKRSDKLCFFCHPEQIQNGQLPIFGKLNGNILKLHGAESKLEIGESFQISVKTTKNNFVATRTLNSKEMLNTVVELPFGRYNAQEVYVEFNNPVKPGLKRVNGIAQSI